MPEEEKIHSGVNPGDIRLSLGLEDWHDIIADLEAALAVVQAGRLAPAPHWQIGIFGWGASGFCRAGVLEIESPVPLRTMPVTCKTPGCQTAVPVELESVELCILHFTADVQEGAAAMRRETAPGNATHERQLEIIHYIGERGELLAHVATGGLGLSDEMKARVLNTFLTLMNLRESLDRAAHRRPPHIYSPPPRSSR